MYYANPKIYESAPIVFYEICRRHTSNDPRDCGSIQDFIVGTADSEEEAKQVVAFLQARSDIVVQKSSGYINVWNKIDENTRQTTGERIDELGYIDALNEFRKIDPSYISGDNPTYYYRGIHRLPGVKIS